jgi:hypothetical protein
VIPTKQRRLHKIPFLALETEFVPAGGRKYCRFHELFP